MRTMGRKRLMRKRQGGFAPRKEIQRIRESSVPELKYPSIWIEFIQVLIKWSRSRSSAALGSWGRLPRGDRK